MRKDYYMDINFYHSKVWERFVRLPYGHVLDYADTDGTAFFPTKEECERSMPNPLGWWTPIENGACFTGLYARALLKQYERDANAQTAEEIRTLMGGLALLQDVGTVDGFIARGVGEDGVSHYPLSSDDQFTPWVLAMYTFYRSALCENKQEVKERLLRALGAVRRNSWLIPTEVVGLNHCSLGKDASFRSTCKLLFCTRVLYELTGEESDLKDYQRLAHECPAQSVFSRLEIASHGYAHDLVAFLGVKQNWICTCAHLCLRELARLDKENSVYFRTGMRSNGITGFGIIDELAGFDNCQGGFDVDWRRLNALWEDYEKNPAKGTQIALREYNYWKTEVAPRRRIEHGILGNALFSALISITCGEEKIAKEAYKKLARYCEKVDWDQMHLSYSFVVECCIIFATATSFGEADS